MNESPAVSSDDRTRQLVGDDHRYVWHPFTQQQAWVQEEPLVVERGEGCWLITTDGRRLLDGNSSLWVNLWGHDRPELVEALRRQAAALPHATFLGLTNPPAIETARKLVELAPDRMTRAFFSENGSAAGEGMLKMAFAYHRHLGDEGRDLFVCLDNAYHGDTLGAVSVGGMDAFHALYGDLLFDTVRIASPYCYRCPLALEYPSCDLACAETLRAALEEHGDRIAGVVTEPLVQGAAGMITAPDGHLRRLREICDEFGVLLLVDEVATGFGRTGEAFACQVEGIEPDLMAVGKGLTGGYVPMSATLSSEAIYEAFLGDPESGRTLYHGHSYSGNPIAAAVASANLDLFVAEDIPAMARAKSTLLTELLAGFAPLDHVGEVRQRGLMVGVELVADRATREPFPAGWEVGKRVCDAMRAHDVILRPLGDVLIFMPAPAMTGDDLRLLVRAGIEATAKVTSELVANGGPA